MDRNRRTFLKELGLTALGAGCAAPLLGAMRRGSAGLASGQEAADGRQWAMVVDIEKCLDEDVRRVCTEACHQEHNVPSIPDPEEEIEWIWSERFEDVFPDQVHGRTAPVLRELPVLVLCNHCSHPSCTKVCPTGATWKRESDGLVMMDMHRCIGCRYCMAACPYGARSFNWSDPRSHLPLDEDGNPPSDYPTRSMGVVEKCTFCAERVRAGRTPACVEAVAAVPGGEEALTFGDLADPDSDVSRLLREKHTMVRRVGLGNGPNVYYVVPGTLPEATDAPEA